MKADQLMVPVYINEKIVLDMLAIIEDGFSTVSQVSYTEQILPGARPLVLKCKRKMNKM